MRSTSVRLRLLLWNIGILALVLFGFLIITHVAVRAYLVHSIDMRLTGMAERAERFAARMRDDQFRPMPPPPRENEPRAGRDDNRRWRMRLFDTTGKPMPIFIRPDLDEPTQPWDAAALKHTLAGGATFTFVKENGVPLRVYTAPLVVNGQRLGVVQSVLSFEDARVLLDSLTLMLLLLMPCALLVAGVSGLYLTNHTLRPIRQMVETADAMNPEDLSQRLPVAGGDEFGHLATTMNGLLGRVEAAFTRLREMIEHERRFTSDASHELRTPLTAIKANARLALKGERTPAQYREALQAIDQASETMTKLIQDLLLLARTDNRQLALETQPVDTATLLYEAVALSHREGQAATTVDIAPDTPAILGDAQHLRRLLVNLLYNALHYTPTDGRVTLSAARQDGLVVLTVADTGEGIAPEHLPHLTERFYRVDPARSREHGGAGLGLAICHGIVEAHQGCMEIASTPGEGTTVRVWLQTG